MRKDTSENKQPKKKIEGTNYLKKPILKETDIPNPIQGQIKDPDKVFHFMKDVHDSTVPKMWAILLNENYYSVGNEPLALGEHAKPENFKNGALYHYYLLLGAKRFMIVTNHMTDDATPTDEDRKLIKQLQMEVELFSFKPDFYDYVIVAGDHYWSMSTQDGTACHCGQQHHMTE